MNEKKTYEIAHKELHNKIWDCKCKPYLRPWKYCKNCKKVVLDFLDKYGAGTLTNDLKIDELQETNAKLVKENKSLSQKLEAKSRKYEELKNHGSQNEQR